jgi:CRP-like cAMP-binding protein
LQQPVHLERKRVLFRAHEPLTDVYFPDSAVISLVVRLESGESLEVGVVGRDGLIGTALPAGVAAMPCEGIVQIAGLAHRIPADVLRREMLADEALQAAIGRFGQLLFARGMQMSACNMFHTVEQRCVRWLLTVSDLVQGHVIPVTHEMIANRARRAPADGDPRRAIVATRRAGR